MSSLLATTSDLAIRVGLRGKDGQLVAPSDYQMAIFEFVEAQIKRVLARQEPESLVIKAVAGAGKTKTIVACTNLIPKTMKVIFLAFNTRNADDLVGELAKDVDANTINSRGWRIWSRYIQGRDRVWPSVDKRKIDKIMRKLMTADEIEDFGEEVKFFVDMARSYGVVPRGMNNCVSVDPWSDNDEFWGMLVRKYNRFIEPEVYETIIDYTRQVLRADLADEQVCDFNDQIYFPVVKRTYNGARIPAFQFNVVIVDEAQDINPVQRALLSMLLRRGGFVIAVGDERQAIYGFRGADTESIDKISAEFNAKKLNLSITYRCAKAIVAKARKLYPEIEAAPGAPEGEVIALPTYKVSIFNPGDMIICRNNAPLIKFAYKLIRSRVACYVVGRDIGEGIVRIIKKVVAPEADLQTLTLALGMWRDKQIDIVRAQDEFDEESVEKINDRYETVMIFVQECAGSTAGDVISDVKSLFSEMRDEDGKPLHTDKVILGTIHKMKGGEADTVYSLDDFLLYPGWVQPESWQYIQEKNLDYVKTTRARLSLRYITTKGMAA